MSVITSMSCKATSSTRKYESKKKARVIPCPMTLEHPVQLTRLLILLDSQFANPAKLLAQKLPYLVDILDNLCESYNGGSLMVVCEDQRTEIKSRVLKRIPGVIPPPERTKKKTTPLSAK